MTYLLAYCVTVGPTLDNFGFIMFAEIILWKNVSVVSFKVNYNEIYMFVHSRSQNNHNTSINRHNKRANITKLSVQMFAIRPIYTIIIQRRRKNGYNSILFACWGNFTVGINAFLDSFTTSPDLSLLKCLIFQRTISPLFMTSDNSG